jgi:hypothetical protein
LQRHQDGAGFTAHQRRKDGTDFHGGLIAI